MLRLVLAERAQERPHLVLGVLAHAARVDENDVGVPGLVDGHRAFGSGPIGWMADNQQKGVSAVPALTIHSSPEFAEKNLESDPDRWMGKLLLAARPFHEGTVVKAVAHRWRFAQPQCTLDAGAVTWNAGAAAGRRAQLPWGAAGFDINAVNTEGQTIIKRALEWAAGASSGATPQQILLVVADAGSLSAQDLARKTLMEGWGYGVKTISASDTHSRKNANVSLVEARRQFADMIKIGKARGLAVSGGLQCVFGCRFEGAIDPEAVFDIVKEQLDLGIDELALADSTGMANPHSIQQICARVIELASDIPVILHLHDTEGKGLANVLAALPLGVSHFDTTFGGMGGCPFIKGASGNIATEDLVWMLSQMGIETGIDAGKIAAISRSLESFFNKTFAGKMHRLLDLDDIQLLR